MMRRPRPFFFDAAIEAFPLANRVVAADVATALLSSVDDSYCQSSIELAVANARVRIPQRIHFLASLEEALDAAGELQPSIRCLYTRSTDGYQRQAALRSILGLNEPWSIPFVVLLAGEYVVEIAEDIAAALPALDREGYINFVRENRSVMKNLRSKATSYWDAYYRPAYPDRSAYPGLLFLHQLETWAS